MGRPIPVKIGEIQFSSKTTAKRYFMDQREAVKEKGSLKEGNFFEVLKALYLNYCDCCESWGLNGRTITSFTVDFEPRQNGQTWASHLCNWVHFSEKQARPFSVREAVDEIAKAAAAQQ
ncbi:hypothetical protein SJZ84_20585 [Hafnia paralvei]|uniref:hypothetical protein n=1 Tax=Hafnia TaxID=568 RepID=UPI00061D1DEC|nr:MULTISPECIES: hypothetical protein [Hafnia]KKF38616.1 hypothetical protein PU01_22340 [Hafnia alvei]MCE9871554.1 hypothetical protein [Hafnia alvei]MDX6913212.1 hypothetical protein [Hafnia paralvei]